MELRERLAAIDRVLADPPHVHPSSTAAFSTEPAAYRLMAEYVEPGTRTLETGLGVSTVLFAIWGAQHTCVVPSPREIEVCRAYCAERGISDEATTYVAESSTDALPGMEGELDLVFIDGCHGWPAPVVDWFYGAGRLRDGGLLLVDDTNLPGVALGLTDYLRRDPRWEPERRTMKWAAYHRRGSGPLIEEHTKQPFLGASKLNRATELVPEGLRPLAGKAARRLRLL